MSMSQVGSGLPRLLAERYELSERLASSGMTSIWRGHDRVLGRDVAVKVLHPELAADQTFRARFSQEAVNAARLTHPNIVALYDTGEQHGVAYIVSEWVEGASLASLLAAHGPMPPPRAARLASDVAMALDYAHGAGVLHRNLKSTNILIASDGTVKVGDFSIAKAAAQEDPERTGEILGSHHLAPEQVESEAVDGRTDVYALGVCLFEMLTGRQPPAPNDGQAASLRSPRSLRAGIPRDLDAVVARAMAPDPAERFQTAAAMAAALASSAADDDTDPDDIEMTAAVLAPAPRRTRRRAAAPAARRRRPWLGWALVMVGMTAVTVAVAIVLIQGIGAGRNTPPSLPGGQNQTSTSQAPGTKLTPVAARSYDPQGTRSADDPAGLENEGKAKHAVDGDPSTEWTTTRYKQANVAGKKGVGLYLDLGSPKQARSLELAVPAGGARVSVYGANNVPESIEGWQAPLAGPEEIDQTNETLSLTAQRPYRYYLIWFTELPPADDGKYRGAISEAILRS